MITIDYLHCVPRGISDSVAAMEKDIPPGGVKLTDDEKRIIKNPLQVWNDILAQLGLGDVCNVVVHYCTEKVPDHEDLKGDMILIAGSPHNVDDTDQDWIPRLRRLLRKEINSATNRPILTICFGCQVLAQVLGGTVSKFDSFQIDGVEIALSADGMKHPVMQKIITDDRDEKIFQTYSAHQCYISSSGTATVLAWGEHCIQAIGAKTNILGVQFHPDFDELFMRVLMKVRQKEILKDIDTQWIPNPLDPYLNNLPKINEGAAVIDAFIRHHFSDRIG